MPKQKKTRSNALVCMKAILATAILLTGLGFTLRRTLLAGLPQYEGAPDLAVPFMLLQDSGPLREARARAAWEAAHAPQEPSAAPVPAAETPAPTEAALAYFSRLFGGGAPASDPGDWLAVLRRCWPYLALAMTDSTPLPGMLWQRISGSRLAWLLLFLLFWVCVYFMATAAGDPFLYFSF